MIIQFHKLTSFQYFNQYMSEYMMCSGDLQSAFALFWFLWLNGYCNGVDMHSTNRDQKRGFIIINMTFDE
jgi:hypothetical protein